MSGSTVSRRALGMAGAGAGVAALGATTSPADAKKRCRKLPEAIYVPADLITFEPAAVGGRLSQGVRATIETTGSGFLFSPEQAVTETTIEGMLPVSGSAETLIYRIVGKPTVASATERRATVESLACSIQVVTAEMDPETGNVVMEGILIDAAGDVVPAGSFALPSLEAATVVALRQPR